ncbi:MAG TPA: hypothetical protein PLP61_13890 [Nocardioides sp.]|uniref:hypothetical protein n=1 Tax=Nocardioides sp. TaxID=35761 RepID=UPI002C6F839E|nr:hypothetical protein [Nocardioides sp.]HQR28126.1 hypothetical protein [Nocardioides sp.]
MSQRPHHRPSTPGDAFFAELSGGVDPALLTESAERAATVLVRGARDAESAEIADRLVLLAETEGLETLAELWAGAPPDSLAGCLWRLYLLRTWVYAEPARVAAEFEAGRLRAQVARVVAGVADPPGPEEVKVMIDQVLRGIAQGDFADVLLRAAAFARVVATGRAVLPAESGADAARMLVLAEQLESAGHVELAHGLG